MISLLIMLPCLTVMADLMGILGGLVVGVFNLDINVHRYLSFSFEMMTFKDIWTGLAKSVMFATAISMVACYVGLETKGGAEGVGKSTTRSVVASFILIILIDCIMTGIFFFSNI